MGYRIELHMRGEVYDDDPQERLVTEVTFTDPERHPFVVTLDVLGIDEPVVRQICIEDSAGIRPRTMRDVPLATYVRAALVAVATWDPAATGDALAPRGRPRELGTDFYREVANSYRDLVLKGEAHPAKAIARRKKVSVNTVYQWVFRARELGFLERRPRADGPGAKGKP